VSVRILDDLVVIVIHEATNQRIGIGQESEKEKRQTIQNFPIIRG
jgi:hypothetical protein